MELSYQSLFFFLLLSVTTTLAQSSSPYVQSVAKEGQGIIDLLEDYSLIEHSCNFGEFLKLNNLKKSDYLLKGKKYKLPIEIFEYNGKSIRSTIGIKDYKHAVRIQKYNEWAHRRNLLEEDYRKGKVLWVPYHESKAYATKQPQKEEGFCYNKLLGEKHEKIKVLDKSLQNKVFYIVAGHGGPDPGAMSHSNGQLLCEDEYAYDVSLRLTKLLQEKSAIVHNIITDPNDGIREEKYFAHDRDEIAENGDAIPLDQVQRLKQRSTIINKHYFNYRKKGIHEQVVVVIHVDSRHANKRQDVFFLHHEKSKAGKELATRLKDTFTEKYSIHRVGGQYQGITKSRNLFMLRETLPPAVYIELANIRNVEDQKRIILASNREALAKWIFEGLVSSP